MSREIKFRAWDYTQNKMREVTSILSVCDGSWSVSYDDENYIDSDNIELMQYTGLKDCKGKEIYEGDILVGEHISFKVKVEYVNGAFETESSIGHYHLLSEFSRCTIIGNIYENSNLLDKEVRDA